VTDKKNQLPLFQAEASWFHVFRSMVDNGDVAKLGPYSTTVYLVIKTYANYSTGTAFPSVELIAEKAGISPRQVNKSLAALEDTGYITKTLKGRSNVYTLREKVEIQGPDGRPEAVATWDYIPKHVQAAQAELKNFLLTGKTADAQIIHIERLTLNIQNGDHNIMLALNDLDGKSPELRGILEGLIQKDRGSKKGPK
jgi:DNA-binding transcriptional regulator YhcF (GntR family)